MYIQLGQLYQRAEQRRRESLSLSLLCVLLACSSLCQEDKTHSFSYPSRFGRIFFFSRKTAKDGRGNTSQKNWNTTGYSSNITC